MNTSLWSHIKFKQLFFGFTQPDGYGFYAVLWDELIISIPTGFSFSLIKSTMICNATFRWHFNMLLPSLVFSFQLGAYSLSLRRVVATCKFTRVEIIGLVLMDNDIKFLIKRSLQRIGNYYTHRLQHTLVKLLLVLIIFPCLHSISCNFMAEVFFLCIAVSCYHKNILLLPWSNYLQSLTTTSNYYFRIVGASVQTYYSSAGNIVQQF